MTSLVQVHFPLPTRSLELAGDLYMKILENLAMYVVLSERDRR